MDEQEMVALTASLFDSYRNVYTDPGRTRSVAAGEPPQPPSGCTVVDRLDGFELHYEFFRAGATSCVTEHADLVIVAYVAGEFNGLEGFRASDAVVGIVHDHLTQTAALSILAA